MAVSVVPTLIHGDAHAAAKGGQTERETEKERGQLKAGPLSDDH